MTAVAARVGLTVVVALAAGLLHKIANPTF